MRRPARMYCMSNVHGAHPGGCERQTRGSPSVTRMLHPGVHDTASCLSRVALVPRRNVRLKVAVQEFDPSHGYWFTGSFSTLSAVCSFRLQFRRVSMRFQRNVVVLCKIWIPLGSNFRFFERVELYFGRTRVPGGVAYKSNAANTVNRRLG